MMDLHKIINQTLFSIFIVLMFLIPTTTASGYWINDYTFTYSDNKLKNSFLSQTHSGTYSYISASNPEFIRIRAEADMWHHGAYANFKYDLSKGVAGYEDFYYTTYKIVVTWTWNGVWNDNSNSETRFYITYTVFYLSGSNLVTLLETTTEFSHDQSWDALHPFSHTITGSNAVYGQELYLKIDLSIVAQYSFREGTCGGDFGSSPTSRYMQLTSVAYYHYVYTGPPVE